MKIELQVKGKEVIIADFKINFDDEDNIFIFCIRGDFSENIKKEINSKKSTVFFQDENLVLELSTIYFYFNLNGFSHFNNKKKISLAFVFLDKNDKIIESEAKIFTLC